MVPADRIRTVDLSFTKTLLYRTELRRHFAPERSEPLCMMVDRAGVEPAQREAGRLQRLGLANAQPIRMMVDHQGIEP
jgi:hypothetical protein